MKTQIEAILTHLNRKSITPLEALENYGAFDWRRSSTNLRRRGFESRLSTKRKTAKLLHSIF
jgi:hypothetical protein